MQVTETRFSVDMADKSIVTIIGQDFAKLATATDVLQFVSAYLKEYPDTKASREFRTTYVPETSVDRQALNAPIDTHASSFISELEDINGGKYTLAGHVTLNKHLVYLLMNYLYDSGNRGLRDTFAAHVVGNKDSTVEIPVYLLKEGYTQYAEEPVPNKFDNSALEVFIQDVSAVLKEHYTDIIPIADKDSRTEVELLTRSVEVLSYYLKTLDPLLALDLEKYVSGLEASSLIPIELARSVKEIFTGSDFGKDENLTKALADLTKAGLTLPRIVEA